MRKAMSRKGSRRKIEGKDETQSPTNSVNTDATGEKKRKVTEGEAVLTAKNYRLAKELVCPISVLLGIISVFNFTALYVSLMNILMLAFSHSLLFLCDSERPSSKAQRRNQECYTFDHGECKFAHFLFCCRYAYD